MLNREIGKHTLIHKQSVAFLGPAGTYSYIAAQEMFSSSDTHQVEYIAMPSIFEVFEKVKKGEANLGVVPVENSIEGAVKDSMNLFLTESVIVLRQQVIEIDHCLLSTANSIEDIKIVKAHPQALGQCKIWLSKNLPEAGLVSTPSNVSPVSQPNEAIIASKQVATLYNLNVLAESISDIKENKTLFYLITQNSNQLFKKETIVSDVDQYIQKQGSATVLFLLEAVDKVGILRDILTVFADQSLSMSRIHSLPTGELGRYYFILDVKIDKNVEVLAKIYSDLEKMCSSVFVLGTI
ncbi:MAG: ACT domain-containing protein [Candidatus Pacebacteria bacterium]|nr:ACT domain-containing protein [Candidatus Paceibacterota bacterium]